MSGDHNMYASGSGDGQRSGWRKRTIMEMAREAGISSAVGKHIALDSDLKRFAELVREEAIAEANARANASWTLMCEKMVAIEREACAKLCESQIDGTPDYNQAAFNCAEAIRARGDKHD